VTPKQVELVRQSFDAIWPVRRKLAAQFYRRFFELAPGAEGLFQGDMERQHLKLMDMIAAIVGTLDERDRATVQAPAPASNALACIHSRAILNNWLRSSDGTLSCFASFTQSRA
jgi:hypothetical protein